MEYTFHYASPLGGLTLAATERALTGLWFDGQKYFAAGLDPAAETRPLPIFDEAARWLDAYFAGREPGFTPPLAPRGTDFQKAVWNLLLKIPYGETTTYGALARELAAKRGLSHFSAQAVGGAVGRNPISLIIPCHRVVGSSGSLTGYAGGVERKLRLLTLEGVDAARFTVPKRGTAL